jgi:signal peptidase I
MRSAICENALRQRLLTRGDNNEADDIGLYPPGQRFLYGSDIVGAVKGYMPYIGYTTIILSEYPWLRVALIGTIGLVVVLN